MWNGKRKDSQINSFIEKWAPEEDEKCGNIFIYLVRWVMFYDMTWHHAAPSYSANHTLTTVPTWLLLASLNADDCLGLPSKFSRSARSLSRSIRFILYTWFGVSLIKRSRISWMYGQRCIGGFEPLGAYT